MIKIVPLIASDVSGPLGVFHLMRLWLKARLFYAGLLADGYDLFQSEVFDQKVLDALGISTDDFLTYIRTQSPAYHELELWVREYPGIRLTAGKGTAETSFHEFNAEVLDARHSASQAALFRDGLGYDAKQCPNDNVFMFQHLLDALNLHEELEKVTKRISSATPVPYRTQDGVVHEYATD